MFFSSDVLLRCMYGRFCEDLIFSDFVCEDRGFSEFRFFLSWTSSCVDIDIDDVDDCQSIYYVVVVIVNHSLLQAILFVSKW